jgi:hypothetical protein
MEITKMESIQGIQLTEVKTQVIRWTR